MAESSGEVIGRYTVEREIGRGGMAIVYLAHDPQLGRPVAIKLIRKGAFPPDQMALLLERFRREAKALGRLNHPHIVKVLDYGQHRRAPYLVMEYLEGASLKEIKKPIKVDTAVRLLRPIAEALDYVHRQGLLHRDIKPSNLMIDGQERVLLTDFGIAKWLEDDEDQQTLTGTGMGIGTPEYMAPEQGLGRKIDGRADFYALSVVFFELITGVKPYRGETPFATLMKQANDPIPDPRIIVPTLNESVTRFFRTAMAKEPADRYPSVQDFLRDFDGLALQAKADRARGVGATRLQLNQESTTHPGDGSSVEIRRQGVQPESIPVTAEQQHTIEATEQRTIEAQERSPSESAAARTKETLDRIPVRLPESAKGRDGKKEDAASETVPNAKPTRKRSFRKLVFILILLLGVLVGLPALYSYLVEISDDTPAYVAALTVNDTPTVSLNRANPNGFQRPTSSGRETDAEASLIDETVTTAVTSTACSTWDWVKIDHIYGTRLEQRLKQNNGYVKAMIGGMVVFTPPRAQAGTNWEASISPNAFEPESKRKECKWISGRLHCGPFAFTALKSDQTILVTVFAAGTDCVGTTGRITKVHMDAAWSALSGQ